ncbi:MAG TPA: hypothetical protein VLL97_14030, partial [Acidobacteriota bacterium]|nr:hypothetical protein [Acidobacteriota bacterium]
MIRLMMTLLTAVALFGAHAGIARETVEFKNFTAFRNLVPGVDFYASNKQLVAPYLQPAAEAIARLKELLGPDIPKGAIFISSTLAQRDSVFEPRILRAGYGWTLNTVTADVQMQETMERIKAQLGDNVPAEIADRMKNIPREMSANVENQMVLS